MTIPLANAPWVLLWIDREHMALQGKEEKEYLQQLGKQRVSRRLWLKKNDP